MAVFLFLVYITIYHVILGIFMAKTLQAYVPSFIIALIGGAFANILGLPIPWLLGSLFAMAGCSLAGLPTKSAGFSRKAGLMVIGISLGLYFTPQMAVLLGRHAYLMVAVALFSISLGFIGAWIIYKMGGVDFKTAWFASVIGGASEMSNFAEKQGARVDQVVAAHSLRVFLVVTSVPFFYQLMGYRGGDDVFLTPNQTVSIFGLMLLLTLSTAAAKLFEKFHLSNPWTFAPLLVTVLLTVNNIHLSAMPTWLSALGQVCIGWTLGTKFRSDFFATAPRLLLATAVSVMVHLPLTMAVSLGLAYLTGIDATILGLGFAPGGVAEMTITAKTLQLGVPIVTMLHVVRMIAVISTAGILYHWLDNWLYNKK